MKRIQHLSLFLNGFIQYVMFTTHIRFFLCFVCIENVMCNPERFNFSFRKCGENTQSDILNINITSVFSIYQMCYSSLPLHKFDFICDILNTTYTCNSMAYFTFVNQFYNFFSNIKGNWRQILFLFDNIEVLMKLLCWHKDYQ